jgi:hypothetical protein
VLALVDIISPIDFWRWAYSDFLSNAQRGVLAEYIVARALGCTDKGRVEWNAYDLVADGDLKVEVKSAAYLQSWKQKALSPIRFDIAHKRGWDAETNEYALEASRSADLYVFCVFSAQDRAFANPLDLDQWFFLACPTRLLDELFPKQKSVALSSLEAANLQRVKYQALGEHIRSLRANSSLQRTP